MHRCNACILFRITRWANPKRTAHEPDSVPHRRASRRAPEKQSPLVSEESRAAILYIGLVKPTIPRTGYGPGLRSRMRTSASTAGGKSPAIETARVRIKGFESPFGMLSSIIWRVTKHTFEPINNTTLSLYFANHQIVTWLEHCGAISRVPGKCRPAAAPRAGRAYVRVCCPRQPRLLPTAAHLCYNPRTTSFRKRELPAPGLGCPTCIPACSCPASSRRAPPVQLERGLPAHKARTNVGERSGPNFPAPTQHHSRALSILRWPTLNQAPCLFYRPADRFDRAMHV